MRVFDRRTALHRSVGAVQVSRWEQYALGDDLPFAAMWYSVPPGQSSPRDVHPERELSLVISGTAMLEAGGILTPVGPGDAFLLEPQEAHRVCNSSADQALVVFSAYWLPAGTEASND